MLDVDVCENLLATLLADVLAATIAFGRIASGSKFLSSQFLADWFSHVHNLH